MNKYLIFCIFALNISIVNAEVVSEFIASESYSREILDRTDKVKYPSPLPLLKHTVTEDKDGVLWVSVDFIDEDGKSTDAIPVVLVDTFQGTTKVQIDGLLRQFKNLMKNRYDTVKANRSTTDLFMRSEEVTNEIDTLRFIVNSIEEQMWVIDKTK